MDDTALSVHEGGLMRVLSEWSGVGNLYSAVAAASPAPVEREWSPEDVERRAMRILLLQCSPILRRWPKSAREWQNHLPTLSNRHRFWSDVPQTRVDWAKTRRAGWPPSAFAIRRRRRTTDQLTLSVLAWTLGKLDQALAASQSLTGPHTGTLIEQLSEDVEGTLVRTLPILGLLDEADQTPPSRDDIGSVRASGWPWNVVAEVAAFFAAVERGGAEGLARRLLRPDGFPEAIFQLGVLGAVMIACERAGATVTSLRPIGYMTSGPVYRIDFPGGEPWDLWCEAARCWDVYGVADKYRDLARTLSYRGGQAFQARDIGWMFSWRVAETGPWCWSANIPPRASTPGTSPKGCTRRRSTRISSCQLSARCPASPSGPPILCPVMLIWQAGGCPGRGGEPSGPGGATDAVSTPVARGRRRP
ncbi:hypothetical protein ACNQVK_37440 [Mycobacterium sp. 134]|uniref:hypothetical protein n=1 Tax=Mycobacterium sp. 134 TaxID=3400425 RepID=UPI003AAD6C9C